MIRHARILILLLIPVIFATGCISHVRTPYAPGAVTTAISQPGPFGAVRAPVDMTLAPTLRTRRGSYTVQRFSFASTSSQADKLSAVTSNEINVSTDSEINSASISQADKLSAVTSSEVNVSTGSEINSATSLQADKYNATRASVISAATSSQTERYTAASRAGSVDYGLAPGVPGGKTISGKLYSGNAPEPRPVVIVLPVWGISEYPSKKLTRDFLRRSDGQVDVMLVDGRDFLIDWNTLAAAETPEQFLVAADTASENVRNMVIDIRRMVDWLQQQPGTDPERIGIAGFSLSAVAASLALLHEPRFAAGVLVMGGSNPAEIFAVCTGRPRQVREAILRRFDWALQAYQAVFANAFEHGDAAQYSGRIADPSRLLFIEAQYDDCMTKQSRDDLWTALGGPERISFRFRHRGAFYAMTPLGFNVLGRYATAHLTRHLLNAVPHEPQQ